MSDIAALKKQMEMMTAAMTELTMALKKGQKKSSSSSDDESVEKPKRPLSEGMKAWGAFQKRVAAVLKEGEVPLKNYAENMQFSSHLKSVNADYESWDNDEILEQRESWVKPEISKLAAAGKTKRPPSSKSSVASSSNDEAEKVVEEMEKLIKEEMTKEEKKKPKKKAEKAEEEKKPDEKAVEKKPEEKEKKPRGRPPKKAAKEEETEEYTGDINAFKWKGKMFSKTTYNDVIDEDTYAYIGRWDESTNLINEKHPMPAYVKKLLAELEEANA